MINETLACACETLSECGHQEIAQTCSIGKITMLALVDAINPCAIAVLTLILVAILTDHPEKRKKFLYGGLVFCLAVFIGYLFYGHRNDSVLQNFYRNFKIKCKFIFTMD
jgi:cytochrome c biogenesis protein CcdA